MNSHHRPIVSHIIIFIDAFDLSKLAPWAAEISIDSFKPDIKSVNVGTVSGGISTSISVALLNPTPLSLKIGFISLSVGLQASTILDLTLSDIVISKGQQIVNLTGQILFNSHSDMQDAVGSFVKHFVTGNGYSISDSPLAIMGVEFGESRSASIQSFKN